MNELTEIRPLSDQDAAASVSTAALAELAETITSMPLLTDQRQACGRFGWLRPKIAVDQRRYAVPATGVLAAACAAAAVAIFATPGGPVVSPRSAAAAVLDRAAIAAQHNPTLTLKPGQYLYSEIKTLAGVYSQWGSPSQSAYTEQPETVQKWVGSDGADRDLTTYDGPPQFVTPSGRAAWVAAGRPAISAPVNTSSGQYEAQGGAGDVLAPDDLSQLPTDPKALTRLIDTGQTGLNEIVFPFNTQRPLTASMTPGYTFATAAEILATPTLNSSPALRNALYQIMADTPGVKMLGTASDHSGRTGTEIAGPVGGVIGSDLPYGANGFRDEIIVDPATGDLLEIKQVNVEPSLNDALITTDYGNTAGQTLTWTDYLASSVVDSKSATTVGEQPSNNGG